MTDFNTAARSIISANREAVLRDDKLWSPARIAILNLFDAYPARGFEVPRLTTIVSAVEYVEFDQERIQKELSKLVREKVLRVNPKQGKRFYEIAVQF